MHETSHRAARSCIAAPCSWATTLAALLALGGCASSHQAKQQNEMAELQRALPGEYTTSGTDGDAVTFTIAFVTAQLIGDSVYFVRETPSNNDKLVLWEGIWTLVGEAPHRAGHDDHATDAADQGPDEKLRIVQHSSLFKEPRRFAEADTNPELLESMLPQDLKALPGCELIWHKDAMGFATGEEPSSCHPGHDISGQWMATKATLQGSELTLIEHQVNDNGALDIHSPAQTLHLSRTGSAS